MKNEELDNFSSLAHEAMFGYRFISPTIRKAIAAVAPLIAAAERERCARVADAISEKWAVKWRGGMKGDSHLEGKSDGADEVAAAIRATPPEDGGKP